MKASETILRPMLEGSRQYVIPLFQRVYCWKKKEWGELWRDLLDVYGEDSRHEHFMGAVVTMPVDMKPHDVSKYVLIDGQQRLTTLFIILAVIRDLADGEDELADQIKESYLINKWGKGTNRLKLLPTKADRDVFLAIISQKLDTENESPLRDAYRFFLRRIKGRDNDGEPVDLKRLHDTLMHRLAFVSVVLDTEDSPYRIFHSLNGTGVPLTQADLVRNHIFMYIPDPAEQEVAYEDLWLPMQSMLGNNLTDFMWRYITKDGTSVRQNAIYDAMRTRISRADSPDVIDTLGDMHTYANYYIRLIDPDQEPDLEIQRRLKRFNRWEINTAYPFLLNIYHDLENGRVSSVEMCQILDLIESFVVRRFFCRIPTNALNKYFVAMYHSLDPNNLVVSAGEYLLARRFPTDEDFLEGWARQPIYTSGTPKCRHILETLEIVLNDNNEVVDMAGDRITIEHVMPQTLDDRWRAHLGPDADNIHAVYLHTVGNLTLTGKNESMGNVPFQKKKQTFHRSNFALNTYFGNCSSWTEEDISARAQWLGQIALQAWRRPSGEDKPAVDSEDPTGRKPLEFSVLGKDREARTWRDVLLGTCAILAEHHGQDFAARATRAVGSKRQYVGYTSEGMINPAQIPGTDLWIETNQSARSVLATISHILAVCGHEEDDFEVVWE